MNSKRNINKDIYVVDVIPKAPGNNKKPNVNMNTYMKKSKRNSNKENNVDIISDVVIPDITPDIIPECIIPDIIPSSKALNLIKARQARQTNINNNKTGREERIINLINEIKQEEIIKLENKTEKLKNKLMKLI